MTDTNRPQEDARLQAIREALAELRAEYSVALPGVVDELVSAARSAFVSIEDPDLRHVQTLAHRMHGAAGSYGFKAVSASAAKLEELLALRAKGGEPHGEALRDAVLAAVVDVQETANRELAELARTGV